jgi:hypothetical protein
MKVTLKNKDYVAISGIVREKLKQLLPDNEFNKGNVIFGPEFMAKALRTHTPSTQVDFSKEQIEYIKLKRKEIKDSTATEEEKKQKIQHLESIMLFGQILFAQSSSLHFLRNSHFRCTSSNKEEEAKVRSVTRQLAELNKLIEQEGILHSSSRLDALKRRKQFNLLFAELQKTIRKTHSLTDKNALLDNLTKSRGFYYQANDFNFKYANKPSRSYSNFVHNCASVGSKVALTASIIAIGASALAAIPPLTPFMAPIALVASSIALAISIPLALKTLGTMIYNMIRFGVEPSPKEIMDVISFGVTLLFLSAGPAIQFALKLGLVGQNTSLVGQIISFVINAGHVTFDFNEQIKGLSKQEKINLYKTELEKLKIDEEEPQSIPSGSKL